VTLLLNAAATLFMTGLIWFVQIVHYPLFGAVGSDAFRQYEARHADLTTLVVVGPMVTELVSAGLLVWRRPPLLAAWEAWLGLALVGTIWASTALLQVPRHDALARGFDRSAQLGLVTTNWLRTTAWTVRSVLALWWLARALA